jgi:hypothetical protein
MEPLVQGRQRSLPSGIVGAQCQGLREPILELTRPAPEATTTGPRRSAWSVQGRLPSSESSRSKPEARLSDTMALGQ